MNQRLYEHLNISTVNTCMLPVTVCLPQIPQMLPMHQTSPFGELIINSASAPIRPVRCGYCRMLYDLDDYNCPHCGAPGQGDP